jgi:prevent-host-death family protein
MRRVSVTELKNRLSEYLRLVKSGETIEVLERTVPIARIQSVREPAADGGAHLARLLRDGLVSRADGRIDRALLKKPAVPCTADAVRVLIEERGDR